MNAPSRKFSTVLPSVASLRSKFEKPGQQPPNIHPPLIRTASQQGGFLKTASSQTALLKSSVSKNTGLVAPSESNGIQTAPSMGNLVIKTKLEPTIEETEPKTPTTPQTPASDKSTPEVRKPSIVAERKPSVASVEPARKASVTATDIRRTSSAEVARPETNGRKASVVADPPAPPRKASVVAEPPPVPPPAPPLAPPPAQPVEQPPIVVEPVVEPVAPQPAVVDTVLSPNLRTEGMLYCVAGGYGWELDAMRNLSREIEARLGKESYLDPTTCRSLGMQTFLDNCECVLAFMESATISGTVRYQIARGVFLKKKLVLFHVGEAKLAKNMELLDHLVSQLCSSKEDGLGKSKEDWKAILQARMKPFVFSPHAETRRQTVLAPLEDLLTGKVNTFKPGVLVTDPPPSPCAFFIHGFDADALDRLSIELQARGYPSYVSESVVKANAGVFLLPSEHDEQHEDYMDKRVLLESTLRECRGRGMNVVGIKAPNPSKWFPLELDGSLLAFDAPPEDVIRACDVPALPLKMQGDALEPFRLVSEKARRFSSASNRDTVRHDILGGKTDKLTIVSAPSGWGKTTLMAEVCRRHSRVVATLSRSVWDQSETVAACFFFNRQDPSRSNFAAHCFKSISRQLSGSVPGFALEDSAMETVEDPSASVTALLETLIVQPAAALSSKGRPPTRRVLVMIDAIDECEDFEQLQAALNAKWQSSPNWLCLVCSCTARPQIVAKHIEYGGAGDVSKGHVGKYLADLIGVKWQCPDAQQVISKLQDKCASNFLWLSICEPILVDACESAALNKSPDTLPYFETSLPSQPGVDAAVKFVFDRYVEQEADKEKVRQAYALAVCAPRSFLPVEIYSYCGVERIPPLLVIEDLCVRPCHARVLDALLNDCGVKLDMIKDQALVSDALEKAYLASAGEVTPLAKRFAAAHASRHARLAERLPTARLWFEDFARLFDSVTQCVKETGDAFRTAQDGEDCGVPEDVVDVVRLSSFAVAFDVREFPGQVIGRLGASHPLSQKARDFAEREIVQGDAKTMVALPNAHFSGLTPARGPLRKVLRHRGPVLATAESNGFALTCSGPVGFIWNINRAEKVGILKGHTEDIRCCSFGCSLATPEAVPFMAVTAGADNSAKLWQGALKPATLNVVFACTKSFVGHDLPITCLVFRAPLLITASVDKTIIVWDSTSGQMKSRFKGHAGEVRAIALSVDGSVLLSGSHDKTARLWNVSSGKDLGRLEGHTRDVSAVCCGKDRFFTASFDGIARAFDSASKKKLMEYKGHSQRINSIALSPDGTKLATGSFDGTARVFDVSSGELLIALKGHANDVNCVRFCSDPARCITSSLDCEVRVWSLSQERIDKYRAEAKIRHDEQVTCLCLTKHFACSGSADGFAKVWNLDTGQLICVLEHSDESLSSVAVSEDGTRAVTGSEDGEVRLWQVEQDEGKELFCLREHQDAIESVSISEDGQYARTVSYDKQLYVWDFSTGRTASPPRAAYPVLITSRKQESRHVLGPTGASVGFTLDSPGFAVGLFNEDETQRPRTFGELGDLFYLWEWVAPK